LAPSTSMSFCTPPCADSAASALAAPMADEKTTRSCVVSVEEARRQRRAEMVQSGATDQAT
jgi:hypothetical protein